MKFRNNDLLRAYLLEGGFPMLALWPGFNLDEHAYQEHFYDIKSRHSYHSPEELEARAVYRTITHNYPRLSWVKRLQLLSLA